MQALKVLVSVFSAWQGSIRMPQLEAHVLYAQQGLIPQPVGPQWLTPASSARPVSMVQAVVLLNVPVALVGRMRLGLA